MKALINGWRAVWNQGDFPFYFVQLAPFTYGGGASPYFLPEIWEAQTATLALANTGMAVTTDIGNLRDIHPRNKQEVGRRLALWALAKTYGREDITYSGPLYKSMAVDWNTIRLSFDFIGSGLISRDDEPLTWFEIAGEDKNFVKADATIEGDTIVVSSRRSGSACRRPIRLASNGRTEPSQQGRAACIAVSDASVVVKERQDPAILPYREGFRTHPW